MSERRRSGPNRVTQRGVALLTAIVIVALATVVAAAIVFDTGLVARRSAGGVQYQTSLYVAQAAEALAAYALADQRRNASAAVHPAQAWAQRVGPIEIPEVPDASFEAQVEDLQGRFNLNNLLNADGSRNDDALEVFRRLLENLDLEAEWAERLVDWIDPDIAAGPGGAEDAAYTALTPPYRTANRPISSPSELLALRDFGAERYARLAPFVAALPRGSTVNLCTASPQLLDALTDQIQWSRAPQALARNRVGRCFPTLNDFRASFLDPGERDKVTRALPPAETSDWFMLRSVVTVGTSQFALYSLLRFESGGGTGGRVRVVMRTAVE